MEQFSYKGVPVEISFEPEESRRHLAEDFAVLEKEGIDQIIRERFLPWFKGEEFKDREDEKIFEALRVYEILYSYGRIVAGYSPTGQDAYFGQFEFSFESSGDYTVDMLEATAMQVYVFEGAVVKVDGYEI